MRKVLLTAALIGLLGGACGGGSTARVATAGVAGPPAAVRQAAVQTAAEAALAFVEAVIAGEDVRPFIVDIRGTFIGESIGFRGPYVPAPEIAEGVLAATRPFVGLRAEVTNAETLRVLEDGRLVEKPDRSGPGRPLGPGCALWGDIHIACSVRLHTAGSDGEFVVAMISRQAFRDLQGDRPLWLVDGFGVTIPLLPFTG